MDGGNLTPGIDHASELAAHYLEVSKLPGFPAEPLHPIALSVPSDEQPFSYTETLGETARAHLNELRLRVRSRLTDPVTSTMTTLEAHMQYLRALPTDTGDYAVYHWGEGKSMSVRYERFHLLRNVAWLHTGLAASAASTGEFDVARTQWAKAAGAWELCGSTGFDAGESSWDPQDRSTGKNYVKTMQQLALAQGQTVALHLALEKRPAGDPAREGKWRRFFTAVTAEAHQQWTAAARSALKACGSAGTVAGYAQLMQHTTRTLTLLLVGDNVLRGEHPEANTEQGQLYPFGLTLRLYREAREAGAIACQLPILSRERGPGKHLKEAVDSIKSLTQGEGGARAPVPATGGTVSLRSTLVDHVAYQQQLLSYANDVHSLAFARFNHLEGYVHGINKDPEAPATVVEGCTRPTLDVAGFRVAAILPDVQPEQRVPDPFSREGEGTSTTAERGAHGGRATDVGADVEAVSVQSDIGEREGEGGASMRRIRVVRTPEQQIAERLLHQAAQLRVVVESRLPVGMREVVLRREQVMRLLISSNRQVEAVITTLQDETLRYLREVSSGS